MTHGKEASSHLESREAGHPQLVTVRSGRHERHPDQVGQEEYQEVAWDNNNNNNNHADYRMNLLAIELVAVTTLTFARGGEHLAGQRQVEVGLVELARGYDLADGLGSKHPGGPPR